MEAEGVFLVIAEVSVAFAGSAASSLRLDAGPPARGVKATYYAFGK
jgi:hypothetical protein